MLMTLVLMALQALEATQNIMVVQNLGVMVDIIVWKDICKRSFLVKCSQGSPDAYDLSLDGFAGPGGHPEQHGGPKSWVNGRYYCFEGYLFKKFSSKMLPGLSRCLRP